MKQYTFSIAPVIEVQLQTLGYDTAKVSNAVESHGNDNLKIVDTSAKSSNRYTAERATARTVKPSASQATATTTIRFTGDGSPQRMFAAWHDDAVKMVSKYGALIALPLPIVLRTWLDAKFKATVVLSAPKSARQNKPAQSAPVVPTFTLTPTSNGTVASPTK